MRILALIPWIPSLLWCVAFLSTIIGTEILIPHSRITSDFHLNFYSAGYLVAHDQAGLLYPPSNATTFINTPFDQFIHQFYEGLSKNLYGTFLYTPLVAAIFSVFAPLPVNIALLVYQALNVAGIVWLGIKAERAFGIDARKVFLGSLLFFPISGTLWLGQVSMIFGLFPPLFSLFRSSVEGGAPNTRNSSDVSITVLPSSSLSVDIAPLFIALYSGVRLWPSIRAASETLMSAMLRPLLRNAF